MPDASEKRIPEKYPSGHGWASMTEVRAAIDRIDDELVRLLTLRLSAIRRASQLKSDPQEALVEWRVEQVAQRIRTRAAEIGFDDETAERIWRYMMQECIDFERRAIAAKGTSISPK